MPEVEAEIDNWDPEDAMVFVFEWALEEMSLNRLENHAARGVMTPDQGTRYEDLKKLIVKNRPIIDRLARS